MEHGDISNREAGRLWFVCEGLVLLPLRHEVVFAGGRRMGSKRKWERKVRASFEMNRLVSKRVWDLTWRFSFRCSVVTFIEDPLWVEVVQEWFDEVDFPAPLRAYSMERFLDEVVTLPSCVRVFDHDSSRTYRYGSKGVIIDPHYDFEPLN